MATINETRHWTEHIYEIATTDDVIGGSDGISNIQANQLASRTNYLKNLTAQLDIDIKRAQALAQYANLPAGTRLPFAQAAAPTGWTQVVDDSTDNRMLRVVSASGGNVGGVHSPIMNNVVPAHTHTFVTGSNNADHTHGVADPGHAHSVYDPGHAHSLTVRSRALSGNGISDSGATVSYSNASTGVTTTNISIMGATTGIYLGGVSSNHAHSGATDNGSSQTNWQPRYIDLIICVKN